MNEIPVWYRNVDGSSDTEKIITLKCNMKDKYRIYS
jgi:hypothetical protein